MKKPLGRATSLQTRIVRPLLRSIFTGEIPGGTRLVEQEMATRLQISRAPVREALQEIANMGLIEIRPNRGAVVCPFTASTVRGIYRVRRALESDAAFLAAGRIPSELIEKWERTFEDLLVNRTATHAWSERAIESDENFHEMIATHSEIPRLAREIHRYHLLVEEIRETLGARYSFQEEAVAQHVAVLKALKSGSGEVAEQAMRDHISDAAEHAVHTIFPRV